MKLSLSREEYDRVKRNNRHFILLPIGGEALGDSLTVSKIGNSHHILLPKKLLRKYNVEEPEKKAGTTVVDYGKDKYLVVRLYEFRLPSPVAEVEQ